MFLVLIETSGNQNYIFSTNKLKENIGASELTYQAGTKWVLEAVEQISQSKWSWEKKLTLLRDKLLDATLNKPIETGNHVKVEVILATSGKALLLTQNKEDAQTIIRYVTKKALNEAPGLDIGGVIQKIDWENDSLGEINRKIHQKFESVRSQKPALDLRFLRLPIIAQCSTSGLPASNLDEDKQGKSVLRSAVSNSKRKYSQAGFQRIARLLNQKNSRSKFVRSVRLLDEELRKETNKNQPRRLEWLSVIHADGNGLGSIFIKFDQHINDSSLSVSQANRHYVEQLKKFSIALDICTENAFLSALEVFKTEKQGLLPIVPLILGGDDLTVLCDGKYALNFTEKFLRAFEKETSSLQHLNGIIPQLATKALNASRLSACAGVTIHKPHFPFSVAYELAEELMQSAKQVKKKVVLVGNQEPYPCSALDFHVLYDSSDISLKNIRDKLKIQDTKLHNRPYVVTPETDLQGINGCEWANFHRWEQLKEKVKILLAKNDEGRRNLPNSQMHDLRAALFLGNEVADARYGLIRERYRHEGIVKIAGSEDSLFQKEPDSEIHTTALLDIIDAAYFMTQGGETNE